MDKLIKIPFYVPFLGILLSFGLLISFGYIEEDALLIAGILLLHLCGWVMAVKFFACAFSSFGAVLSGN